MKKLKKLLITTLVLALSITQVQATAVDSSDVAVKLTQEASQIDVILSTGIPIDINSKGIITVADNLTVINNSPAPVEVTGVKLSATDFTLVDWNSYAGYKAGEKYLTMKFDNQPLIPSAITFTDFIINKDSARNMKYDAKLPVQLADVNSSEIAQAVFTIDWADGADTSGASTTVTTCDHAYVEHVCTKCGEAEPGYYASVTVFYPWDELTATYGLDVESDYTEETAQTSPSHVAQILPSLPTEETQSASIFSLFTVYASEEYLSKLVIPSSITRIGNYALTFFDGAENVTIQDGVTQLGEGAFEGSEVSSVELPDTISKIPDNAFKACTDLTDITLPTELEEIGDGAFSGCTSLSGVIIPDSVTKVGPDAFTGVSNVTGGEDLEGYPFGMAHTCSYEWVDVIKATCTEDGKQQEVCTVCRAVGLTMTMQAQGHKYVYTTAVEPTCTELGISKGVCACGDTTTGTIPMLGHNYGESVTTKTATCTEYGEKKSSCTRCDAYMVVDVSPTGHSYKTKSVTSEYLKSEATCTSPAYYYYKCDNCDAKGTSTYRNGSSLGHIIDTTGTPTYTIKGESDCTECLVYCCSREGCTHNERETTYSHWVEVVDGVTKCVMCDYTADDIEQEQDIFEETIMQFLTEHGLDY